MNLEILGSGGRVASTRVEVNSAIELFGRPVLAKGHDLALTLHSATDSAPEHPERQFSVQIDDPQHVIHSTPEAQGAARLRWNGIQVTLLDDAGTKIGTVDRPNPLGQVFRFWQQGQSVAEATPLDAKRVSIEALPNASDSHSESVELDSRLLLGWILGLVLLDRHHS